MKLALIICLFVSNLSLASVELKVGDILLQPTDCWSCSLIESEEETIYSHMGIVLQVLPKVLVAESLGKVRLVELKEFDRKTEKNQKLAVLRFNNVDLQTHIEASADNLQSLFKNEFENLSYDHQFLWDNFDDKGQSLYCSEFVGKFLQAFVGVEPPIKRMHFSRNREQWEKYFKGQVPVGKWGNSPGDYEKSDAYHIEGEL